MKEFNIDFRNVNLLELKRVGILSQEIKQLFLTENSNFSVINGVQYVIGYVNQTKFIHVGYTLSKNVNFDIELIDVGIPNEKHIRKYWCSRKNKK